MPPRLPYGYLAYSVYGTGKFHLLFPIEIRQVKELEFAVGEKRADHVLILRSFCRLILGCGTERIRYARPLDGLRDQLPARSDDVDLNPLHRKRISCVENR